jgi:SAM-dependent methyltransferase
MGWVILQRVQFQVLKRFYKLEVESASASGERLGLEDILGNNFVNTVKDKIVIDYGCGHGGDVQQIAEWHAGHVLGIEIREELVKNNQERIKLMNCSFHTTLPAQYHSKADIVVSIDAFEHFDRPDQILQDMLSCLRPGGEAFISFGPTWYHPYGGHLFSIFPWAHLLLSERALIKWRAQYFKDGATKFAEVAGGLNKMTIGRFKNLVAQSGFALDEIRCVPIRKLKFLRFFLGEEFTTAFVSARLIKKA